MFSLQLPFFQFVSLNSFTETLVIMETEGCATFPFPENVRKNNLLYVFLLSLDLITDKSNLKSVGSSTQKKKKKHNRKLGLKLH